MATAVAPKGGVQKEEASPRIYPINTVEKLAQALGDVVKAFLMAKTFGRNDPTEEDRLRCYNTIMDWTDPKVIKLYLISIGKLTKE